MEACDGPIRSMDKSIVISLTASQLSNQGAHFHHSNPLLLLLLIKTDIQRKTLLGSSRWSSGKAVDTSSNPTLISKFDSAAKFRANALNLL